MGEIALKLNIYDVLNFRFVDYIRDQMIPVIKLFLCIEKLTCSAVIELFYFFVKVLLAFTEKKRKVDMENRTFADE